MKKVFFYIGSNNTTHELESEKIEKTLSSHFEGFTAFEVVGYWRGSKERTLKAEAITEKSDSELTAIAKELRIKLEQESILMEIVESNSVFIQ